MTAHGIHHVTAIAGPARRSRDFYVDLLGLRMVKRTVNFDDPTTYHFYYGDEAGNPGTIITHFPWEHVAPGRLGNGETEETVLRVPEASLGYWMQRFLEKGITHETPKKRFGETVLSFKDPDGMRLALAALPGIEREAGWTGGGVPAEHAVRGIHGVSLLLDDDAATGAVLTDVLGFEQVGREDSLVRFRAPGTSIGGIVDIHAAPGFLPARMGGGSVHHVAFRAADDAEQAEMAEKLVRNHQIMVTEQKNRDYFRSVYFRAPGGTIFEIATDEPGFAVDEPAAELGTSLKLPRFLESRRAGIEAALPPLA
ncbi:MAG TPA: ring-cleaving dioxygenase [Geminicoccus sp.]|jgi:glyoxalase family protein|uniref:ring-cleaving dioxygenase n=1 Tax=Geminicoccus sp. TaxID=2024832 RepID=UPI002E36648A|nr:ring-cleaving dioxygenase [Geminicoccus sp.]HEX2528164.1 ring-cleaving dioxygenase [Geminicoccus sp.]